MGSLLLCKQAKKGIQLQAEQSDWLADTDEEIDEQELDAHYSYMAKIQEVPNANSGTDSEPLEQIVQLILFIVDSGCTKHMTGNLTLLCNFVEKYLGTVHFGNDQFAPILGYGDLVQGNIMINRVYYVEGLNHNLFSVGQFCDADLEVAFRKSTCFVRDLQGNDLLTGNRGSDLYTISLQETTSSTPICLMANASPTQAWLWHRRLSHLNFDYINLLSKKDVVIGLPKLKYVKDQLCSSCEVSKAKRSSFKSKTVPSSKGRLNLLHMDLCGPMRVASINGKKYILVIVDDYSRYTWTLFLRSKDATPEVLKDFLTMILRNLEAPVISVHTDRGTEFLNKTLNAFFKEEGIEHQTSTPRTPEQNSIKIKQTGDTCILVGYSTQSKGYRIYNKRTRLIVESIHLRFDEIKEMSETSVANDTSGLVPNVKRRQICVHAGCFVTRKSTSGGIQFLGDKLVSWMSKKQDCTAMSSAEAEYVALSASCAQVMWMRTQLQDFGLIHQIPFPSRRKVSVISSDELVEMFDSSRTGGSDKRIALDASSNINIDTVSMDMLWYGVLHGYCMRLRWTDESSIIQRINPASLTSSLTNLSPRNCIRQKCFCGNKANGNDLHLEKAVRSKPDPFGYQSPYVNALQYVWSIGSTKSVWLCNINLLLQWTIKKCVYVPLVNWKKDLCAHMRQIDSLQWRATGANDSSIINTPLPEHNPLLKSALLIGCQVVVLFALLGWNFNELDVKNRSRVNIRGGCVSCGADIIGGRKQDLLSRDEKQSCILVRGRDCHNLTPLSLGTRLMCPISKQKSLTSFDFIKSEMDGSTFTCSCCRYDITFDLVEYPTKMHVSSFAFILSRFSPSLVSIACGFGLLQPKKNKGSLEASCEALARRQIGVDEVFLRRDLGIEIRSRFRRATPFFPTFSIPIVTLLELCDVDSDANSFLWGVATDLFAWNFGFPIAIDVLRSLLQARVRIFSYRGIGESGMTLLSPVSMPLVLLMVFRLPQKVAKSLANTFMIRLSLCTVPMASESVLSIALLEVELFLKLVYTNKTHFPL
ncbi:retrovirus-related pol polyprotein from transposon TNT 1-94 [Tanacetum coccineum]